MLTNDLFTFWASRFLSYDIVTEYLTLFWFAMPNINQSFQSEKVSERCLSLL